jgi:hypothetical protein
MNNITIANKLEDYLDGKDRITLREIQHEIGVGIGRQPSKLAGMLRSRGWSNVHTRQGSIWIRTSQGAEVRAYFARVFEEIETGATPAPLPATEVAPTAEEVKVLMTVARTVAR